MRKIHPRFFAHFDPLVHHVLEDVAVFPIRPEEAPKQYQRLLPRVKIVLPKHMMYMGVRDIKILNDALTIILSNIEEEKEREEEERFEQLLRSIPKDRSTQP